MQSESKYRLVNAITFFVNGEKRVVKDPEPDATIIQYLRREGLTGTKLVCGEGGCGACTVMISHFDQFQKKIVHRSVNACLYPLCSCEGKHVVTVEGLGSIKTKLHPIQERLAHTHSSQCGFCTPGMVMSLYSLLRNKPNPTLEEIEENFSGNLCRCTGYRPIFDAAKSFAHGAASAFNPTTSTYSAEALKTESSSGGNSSAVTICPSTGKPCNCAGVSVTKSFSPYQPNSELIFPAYLQASYTPQAIMIKGTKGTWFRPLNLDDLCNTKIEHPQSRIIVGNSELAIERKFRKSIFPVLIDPTGVPELSEIKSEKEGITFGSCVTLSRMKEILEDEISKREKHEVWVFKALIHQLKWFAGVQIRNAASLGGNIITASPISDLNPVLMCSGSSFTLAAAGGKRRVVNARDFFLDYRKVDIQPEEILLSIFIPVTRPLEYILAYQQCRRREDDIAIVTSGLRIKVKEESDRFVITESSLVFGGMNKTTMHARSAEKFLENKPLTRGTLDETMEYLKKDLPLNSEAPGGMVEYRQSLSLSFFFKFFLAVVNELSNDVQDKSKIPSISPSEESAIRSLYQPDLTGHQHYIEREDIAPVGKAVPHQAALLQVTGEAQYLDDVPFHNCLHAAIVGSKYAHAKIMRVDPSEALSLPGVVAWIDAKDCPSSNQIGEGITGTGIVHDEELFATTEVFYYGQPIGIIVAETARAAEEATLMVKVEYEELPAIVSIQQAIEANSFLLKTASNVIQRGNVEKALAASDHVIQGTSRISAQEHFYLEPQTSAAVPGENGEMMIWSSTQNPSKTQHFVARVLGVTENKIVAKTKRIGGGFGGKETRSLPFSCQVAVAANKLRRPVRICLDRDQDMSISGQRHSFVGNYQVGFNKDGKIQGFHSNLYSNGGFSYDLSVGVMDRAMFHSENSYNVPNVKAVGKICKTNLASNTAYRGFGGPQGMMVCEVWIDHIARVLGTPPHKIRDINLYDDGDVTPYGQKLESCNLRRLWGETMKISDFENRWEQMEKFNNENRYKKRGLSIIPTKFGISFTALFLNQGGALLNIYLDGTVLVTHGGVEMGQGLHTKVIQCVASSFGIGVESVHISETATDKVPNSSPSAASLSSDLYCAAALNACQQINDRLKPLKAKLPADTTWKTLVQQAYFNRINLSAQGFFVVPDIYFNFDDRDAEGNSCGKPFSYFTAGCAAAEVEVDVLTGDFSVIRTDIVMDLGQSLNPAIDVGQIEGAFVQGLGWCTLEEYVWGCPEYVWLKTPGRVFTQGPSTYKIPTFNDIPRDFRIHLLPKSENTVAVHSSKAVGEPPLFLGASVYFAIKEAIYSARKDEELQGFFPLDTPASCERIRMACHDTFTSSFSTAQFKPRGCF